MRLFLLWMALSLSLIAHADDVTWAGNNPLVDQWKGELAQMRAARKPQPMEGCLYSERVLWDRARDTGGAVLQDKRRLMLTVDEAQSAIIDKWEKGKVLVLCYDDTRGATLLEPESGIRVAVRHITDRHPIDDYILSLKGDTTVGMLAVGEEANRLWRLEIDRSVREVLALKYLPKDVRANFIKLSKSRLDYLEQQSRFATASVYSAYSPGTICGPLSTEEIVALYRAASFQLSGLYEYYQTFAEKAEGK
jgi:hypothetical protein